MNITNYFVTNTGKDLLNRLVKKCTNLQHTLSLIQDRRLLNFLLFSASSKLIFQQNSK